MQNQTETKERWPWWFKVVLAISPILVLLAVAMLFDANARRRLDRAMAEARAAGGPVTLEELEAARKVWPDEENGALVILSLTTRLSAIPSEEGVDLLPIVGKADLPPLGQRWTDETDRAVARQLERLSRELADIDRLSDFDGGRFPVTIAPNPLETLLPHLAHVRTSCKLKSLQIIHRAMQGRTASLIDDVTVMLRHGQLFEDSFCLIEGLVRVALDSQTVCIIEHVVAQTTLDPSQLRQLDRLLADLDRNDRMFRAIQGERTFFIGATDFFRATGDLGGVGPSLPIKPKLPGLRGWLMRDQALGLQLFNQMVNAGPQTGKMRHAAREIEAKLQALPSYYVFTGLLVPSLTRALELDLRLTAQIRSARTALAAERYRLDKGCFPEQIDQLMPDYLDAVPTDPFDDKPLRCRVDEDAVTIYSVGSNGIDDGGDVRRDQKARRAQQDWGFILLAPELRGVPAPQKEIPATRPAGSRIGP